MLQKEVKVYSIANKGNKSYLLESYHREKNPHKVIGASISFVQDRKPDMSALPSDVKLLETDVGANGRPIKIFYTYKELSDSEKKEAIESFLPAAKK